MMEFLSRADFSRLLERPVTLVRKNIWEGNSMSSTRRIIASAGLLVALTFAAPASASNVIVPLGISTQSVFWTGEGVNASDDGQVSSTFGTCTSAGGNSTCNIGGSFAFGGGGTYDFQLTGPSAAYPGVETAPFSQLYNFTFPNANLVFSLNFNNGLSETYNNFYFSFSFIFPGTTCTGVSSCNGGLVGATPGATMTGPATFTLTVSSVPVPAPKVAINQVTGPSGPADQYNYQYNDLTGAGDVFIPIIDPSALILSSLPADVTIITSLATIEADWPGAGNIIPYNEPAFDNPAELLEVPEDGAYNLDFSFLDTNLPVDGPILADGTLISDPLVPGSNAIPEPSTWAMMLIGFAGLGFAAYRRSRAAVVPAV
jgi:PEP-CTERM motif